MEAAENTSRDLATLREIFGLEMYLRQNEWWQMLTALLAIYFIILAN